MIDTTTGYRFRKAGEKFDYKGVTYTVLSADGTMALVHDPAANEYGIAADGTVLIFESKAAAENEFWFGEL